MLEIWTAKTPNGCKAAIMLEEFGLPYTTRKIDLSDGIQHTAEFRRLNPNDKIPYAVPRFENETYRLFDIPDERLAERDYLADDYSIADVATIAWIKAYEFSGLTLDGHAHLKAWHDRLWRRPAVARGMEVPESGPNP